MKRLKILLQSKIFLIISILFLILYVLIFTKIVTYSSIYNQQNNTFEGILISYKIDGDKLSFILKAKEKLQISYYFKSLEEKNYFLDKMKLGQTLNIVGELSLPNKNTLPNTFDYQNHLYGKKIFWLVNAEKITIIDKDIYLLYKIKNFFISRVRTFNKTNSYMYAFILGDTGYIDNDVYTNFQDNGVTHLFAVSGMHIGLFITIITLVLKKIHVKDNEISYFIIYFFLLYLFLVGFSASIVRATMFYLLLFLNKRFKWNFKSINLFYFLFWILLLINPFYIYDIGFIYSFLTSFGLMIFSKKITGNYLIKLFKTSTIAFMFSLPITIYFNFEFNLLTIINNLIVVPIVSLFLFPLSLITFIFPFLETILEMGFNVLEAINSILSSISINLVVGKVSLIFILLYYIIVFCSYKKARYYFLLVLLVVVTKYKFYFDYNAYVYFLDVGQGDATLVITEHRSDIILIDSGGKIEYEKQEWRVRNSNFNLADSITKFIKSLGISKLDLFIATHGDKDHIGYAKDLFNEIKVGSIMLNNNGLNNEEKDLLNIVSKQVKNNYNGKEIYIKNLNDYVSSDENDSSLVLYIIVKNKKLLIMGDAPKKVELDIINKYNLKVDILKVGHHGSNTSSDLKFLENIIPKYAIISSGRNNRYHHPSIETIENLERLNITNYNTQDFGTIQFRISSIETIEFYPP